MTKLETKQKKIIQEIRLGMKNILKEMENLQVQTKRERDIQERHFQLEAEQIKREIMDYDETKDFFKKSRVKRENESEKGFG